jgi:hypothetical protein
MPVSLLIWLFLIYQSAFVMSLEFFVLPPFNYFDIVIRKLTKLLSFSGKNSQRNGKIMNGE